MAYGEEFPGRFGVGVAYGGLALFPIAVKAAGGEKSQAISKLSK